MSDAPPWRSGRSVRHPGQSCSKSRGRVAGRRAASSRAGEVASGVLAAFAEAAGLRAELQAKEAGGLVGEGSWAEGEEAWVEVVVVKATAGAVVAGAAGAAAAADWSPRRPQRQYSRKRTSCSPA